MGGDHGHHHGPPYKIPDWRIYKVEDVPLLMKTKEALAAHGLKDPWLRNEVWRYNAKEFGTEGSRARAFFLRGAKLGIPAFILTVIAGEVYDRMYPSSHGHGHGHDEHH